MIMSTSHLFAPALYKDLSYDALTSFTPVTRLVGSGFVMVVHPAVPAANVREFIALAKSQPGRLNFGSSGNGGNQHLVSQMFLNATSTDVKHIPYKGSAPATTDLIGGQVQMSFMALSNAIPHVRAGKMRALAVTSAKRSPNALNIPTVSESGIAELKDYAVENYYGFVAQASTPKFVLKKLEADIKAVTLDAAIQSKLAGAGLDTFYKTPEQTLSLLSSDIEFYKKMSKIANIKQE